jgi:hypothetical protein
MAEATPKACERRTGHASRSVNITRRRHRLRRSQRRKERLAEPATKGTDSGNR